MEQALDEVLRARQCPHLAMLLRTPEEVYVAQASFYGLAIRRNGWVLHRAIPGRLEQDRGGLRRGGGGGGGRRGHRGGGGARRGGGGAARAGPSTSSSATGGWCSTRRRS